MKNLLPIFIIALTILSVSIPLNSVYGAETNDTLDKTPDTIIIIIIIVTSLIVIVILASVIIIIIVIGKKPAK